MSLTLQNTRKSLALASLLLCAHQQILAHKDLKTIVLTSPLLSVADNAGIFHGPIVDILQTRIDIVKLIQGEKEWNGAIMHVKVADTNHALTIYCRRPEIICGAAFIAIAPDHELAKDLITAQHRSDVIQFINNMSNKTFYDRQMDATNDGVFTGSYAVNPFTEELLPIYVSDYAIECFDIRHSKARLGFPAHNSKDLDFAKLHNLPIKIVVDVQRNLQGKKDDLGPVVAAPLLNADGSLKEAYLGEYSACVITNSDNTLNNLSLKDAAKHVINNLKAHNCGCAHTEILQYKHNNQLYSIKDLAKIEAAVYKSTTSNSHINTLKKDLKIALNYAQADFLDIVEKFIINVKNTRALMTNLIQEDCQIRENADCYLLRWSQIQGNDNEKDVFRRDIASMKELTIFCKDLVNFLGDLAHSLPKALENVRKQNQ